MYETIIMHCGFSKNGIRKQHLIHVLVAEAFIPNPCPEKYNIVNHKDENPSNNTVDNLEWCDIPYNNAYGTRNERIGKAHTNRPELSKTVYQYTKSYELVKEWPSTNEIERQTGWSSSNISECCRGKRKSAQGFVWSYTHL